MAEYLEGVTIGGVSYPVIQRVIATPTYILACDNSYAYFSVADAVVEEPKGSLKYQWQIKTSPTSYWQNTTTNGNKTDTIKVSATAARDGYQYRCKISRGSETVTSNSCLLKVMCEDAVAELPSDPT